MNETISERTNEEEKNIRSAHKHKSTMKVSVSELCIFKSMRNRIGLLLGVAVWFYSEFCLLLCEFPFNVMCECVVRAEMFIIGKQLDLDTHASNSRITDSSQRGRGRVTNENRNNNNNSSKTVVFRSGDSISANIWSFRAKGINKPTDKPTNQQNQR